MAKATPPTGTWPTIVGTGHSQKFTRPLRSLLKSAHPELPGRFVLAIECDGAMYHSGTVARERDRLRQQQLERQGWTFHRIWSTDWWLDPKPQVAAVMESYQAALSVDEAEAAPTSAPLKLEQATITQRTGVRPHIYPREPITSYSHSQLVALIRWVKSDDVVRTRDEVFTAAMKELGFKKRDARIVVALNDAIDDS